MGEFVYTLKKTTLKKALFKEADRICFLKKAKNCLF